MFKNLLKKFINHSENFMSENLLWKRLETNYIELYF